MSTDSQDLAVSELTRDVSPFRSKKLLFAVLVSVCLVTIYIVGRVTEHGDSAVELQIVMAFLALIPSFYGAESVIGHRRATVLGQVAGASKPSQPPSQPPPPE